MSDVSATLPLARPHHAFAPALDQPVRKSMGVWATLGWGSLAFIGIYTVVIIQIAANIWAGTPVLLPWLVYALPIGHIVSAAIAIVAIRSAGLPVREYLGLVSIRHADVWRGIGIGVAAWFGMAILFAVIAMIHTALGGAPSDHSTLFKDVAENKWRFLISMYVVMIIAAPIAEELLFRGMMYRGLAESPLGAAGAIVITSIVFGLAHWLGFGWERVVVTGCVGALLGFLRWRTGGTSVPMVAHAATNFMGAMMLTVLVLTAP
jgi:membrane protease YdiL (CAAX protease family)